jgi:kynurenine formamidase
MTKTILGLSAALSACFALSVPSHAQTAKPASATPASIEQAYSTLHDALFVDLTHSFAPDIPHWKGMPNEQITRPFTIAKDGFNIDVFSHPGQWGTHVDPPAHFHEGLRTVDEIDPKEFLLRLVVLDVHAQVAANPDYVVSMDDVGAWERRHGQIPEGAFVALRTDWSKRWPDDKALQNVDAKGVAHYPGWSKDVLHYLYETRRITASGHETTDTDPGVSTTKDDYSLESYLLGTNHFQIEMLANLDQVPEAGALVMVTFPKPEKGSGFPARVVAIVPR